MITLLGSYELSRDKFGWRLTHSTESGRISKKTGKPVVSKYVTYYPWLHQALQVIVDRESGKAADVESLLAALTALRTELVPVARREAA